MSVTKDQISRKGSRLQTNGPVATRYPLAAPIPFDFIRVGAGASKPCPLGSGEIPFVLFAGIDEISISHLKTTGFEGLEGAAPEALPEVIAEPPPVETPRPLFGSISSFSAPASGFTAADYEPMEFLDFDEPFSEAEPDPEPEPEPPAMALDFLAVPVRFANPPAAKLVQGVSDIPMPPLPVLSPELNLNTVRRKMISGPNPFRPQPKPAPVVPEPAPKPAQPIAARPAPAPAAKQPTPQPAPQPRPAAVRVTKPATETKPAPPAPEKPKIAVRPATPPAPVEAPIRIAARDRGGNALQVTQPEPEPIVEPIATPAPKPKLMPIRKVETISNSPSQAAVQDTPFRGLTAAAESPGMSSAMKGGIAAAAVVVLGLGGYLGFSGKGTSAASPGHSAGGSEIAAAGMALGGGGWTTTWGADSPINQNKQISIYRPSMSLTDYRFEFRGQIEKKALGWIFRASNARNYYVMKLEMIKPGPNPIVALLKYAVIDGKETTRTQVILPFKVALDTVYAVRMDVKGDTFSTYVQDKLVDAWTDERIKTGGTGFYSEKGERAQIKSSQVLFLTASR